MEDSKISHQSPRRGRPQKKTDYQSEIGRLLTQWRSGGKLGEQAVQILLEKFNIRAVKL